MITSYRDLKVWQKAMDLVVESHRLCHDRSWAILLWMVLTAALLCLNFRAIKYRFNMYCKAVERSYKVTVLDALPVWQQG